MWSISLKRTLLAGGAALVLGGATIGLVLAQTPTPSTAPPERSSDNRPRPQAFLEALARRLGVTTERLRQAMTEARQEVGLPERGPKHDGRPGPGGPRGFHGALPFQAAAEAIGITVDQLRQELPGKSLAQVAQAHGKNPADVATPLRNALNARIDQAVAAGRLTAERAAEMKTRAAQRIDEAINRVLPERPPGPRTDGPRGFGERPRGA